LPSMRMIINQIRGIIVRAYEICGIETDASIDLRFMSRKIFAHFTPHEIKTIFVPYDAQKNAVETNMLEMF